MYICTLGTYLLSPTLPLAGPVRPSNGPSASPSIGTYRVP